MNETMYSLDVAEYLDERIKESYQPKFDRNDYDNSVPYKRIEIHVDLNPIDDIAKHNKSNAVYQSVMGMLCGMGYSVKAKMLSYGASVAADLLCK